jgi:hypothetical protein
VILLTGDGQAEGQVFWHRRGVVLMEGTANILLLSLQEAGKLQQKQHVNVNHRNTVLFKFSRNMVFFKW